MGWFERLFSFWRRRPAAETTNDPQSMDVIRRMNEAALPCVLFESGNKSLTKFGGWPDLPDNLEWPCWKGRPLAFLAQIDLAQAKDAGAPEWLPSDGMLFFFYDADQSTWGFDPADRGSWAILHGPFNPEAVAHPQSIEPFPEVGFRLRNGVSLPSPERLGIDYMSLSEEEWEAVEKVQGEFSPAHQLGGHPHAIQNDSMELECQLASNGIYMGSPEGYHAPAAKALESGAVDWHLLLQLDSDDDADMMWGDYGRLYFWIKRQDAEQRDFTKAWMILQCT